MHITDQKHIFGRIYYIWKMEEQVWSPLYSIWAVFLIFMLCLVPELLRLRLYKTEAVQNLEKKLEKLRLRARQASVRGKVHYAQFPGTG